MEKYFFSWSRSSRQIILHWSKKTHKENTWKKTKIIRKPSVNWWKQYLETVNITIINLTKLKRRGKLENYVRQNCSDFSFLLCDSTNDNDEKKTISKQVHQKGKKEQREEHGALFLWSTSIQKHTFFYRLDLLNKFLFCVRSDTKFLKARRHPFLRSKQSKWTIGTELNP